jgi:regulatory protein
VPGARLSLHERALRLLAVRQRTRRELQTRLVGAGFDADEVAAELDRLEGVGLVDDARFAAEFAEHALGRRLEGTRAVAATLSAKGLDRALIDEVLEAARGGEAERLRRLAESRAARLRGLPPETAFRRLLSFLVRRGYDAAGARRAATAALELEAGAAEVG